MHESYSIVKVFKNMFIAKTAKVMRPVNLSVRYGLFNGAMGIVRDKIYKTGIKLVQSHQMCQM